MPPLLVAGLKFGLGNITKLEVLAINRRVTASLVRFGHPGAGISYMSRSAAGPLKIEEFHRYHASQGRRSVTSRDMRP